MKGGGIVKKEGFKFVTDKLSCFTAENEIAYHYQIGEVDYSNLPSPLKVDNYNDVHILIASSTLYVSSVAYLWSPPLQQNIFLTPLCLV